jgi:oligoendopeptidase F
MAQAVEKQTGAEHIVWDLSIYYSGLDDARMDTDLQQVNQQVDAFVSDYRGKVAALTAEELGEAYERMEAILDLFGRVASFASLNFSVYSNDPQWGAFIQKITELDAVIDQKMVFFGLEWNEIEDARAEELLRDPVLRSYRYHLETSRRYKPHQLSEAEEKLLIEKSVTGRSAWTRLFQQIMSSIMLDYRGNKLPMPQVLSILSGSPEREARKDAADAITAGLRARNMELTYIFNVLAADKASDDRLRAYPSWITARNLSNKAPDEVVEALVNAATSSYDVVARHYQVKKKLLGFDELFDYDRYAPLNLKESSTFYTWEEARKIVLDAYSAFSPRMGEIAARFFDENWIHAPVMQGKRGGAFASYGTKSTHPWVFVNFNGTANDVMTLAHELGHGLHMYLAGEKQTLFSMYTPLTTAEMASVFGEMIVFQDLMSKESDDEVRLSMLANKIEGAFATVFRQIAMNRFEDGMHNTRRSAGELSSDQLSAIWMETQKAMFQGSVTLRDDYSIWWSYVPHFLSTPGYVYAYAFGELLVLALYNLFQQQGASFVPLYTDLLASGDSDYPVNLLAKVGVNLNDPDFWQQGVQLLRSMVDQEEALARKLYPARFA